MTTFIQPDFTTQTAAVYKANIDASINVVGEIGQQFAAHEAATPDMTALIDAGRLMYGGTLASQNQQTTTTITAPGIGTDPRIDRIVIDEQTGAYSIVTGTPAASPVAPDIPAGKLPNCQFPLTDATAAITNSMITDERVIFHDHGDDVTGYLRGNAQYIEETVGAHATIFDCTAVSTAWETLGKTTGSATNTWAALDDVPSDAKWIDVKIFNRASGSSLIVIYQSLAARKGGDTTAFGDVSIISYNRQVISSTVSQQDSGMLHTARIPINASNADNMLELYRDSAGTSLQMTMYLTGWGL